MRRNELLEICARQEASNVRVFGWGLLIGELEDYLGCAVDVAELPSLKERVRNRVLVEAVPL